MKKEITIVTTFSDKGYEDYGKIFLESCKNFLDRSVDLLVYKDNVDIPQQDNLQIRLLEPNVPDLTAFKKRNAFREETEVKFQYQSVRFSHKVYAIHHAANNVETRYLVWLDSDTELYENVDYNYFINFLPKGSFVGYLGRGGEAFSECGFMIFDLNHSYAKDFFNRFKWYYDTDEIYNLTEWHDSYVFDVVRKEFEQSDKIVATNLSKDFNKHHFNCVLDGYIMHLKGDRKHKREKMLQKALRRKGNLAKVRASW